MQQIKAHRTLSRRRAWPLAIIAGGVVVAGLPHKTEAASTCTDAKCPTDFIQLTSPEIQSTKTSFKFQARISQAKLPVGDIKFTTVIVKLRDSVTTWCSQSLTDVRVRDSVINLEVGPDTGMTCSMPLEDLIAGKNGLGFQICINNEENCLKPIALSSVPYSVKAEYARRAQQSFEADVAAQAHYAHRIAADLDLLQSPTIGTGYYDFHTPLAPMTVTGLPTPPSVSNKEGVMQWTPVATAEKKLNILLKTDANGAVPASFSRLDELKLHAALTRDFGKLEVSEGTKLFQTLDVTGATTMASTLAVTGATTLGSTLGVTGATTLNSTLLTKGTATLQSTLAVTGATTLSSTLGVTGATTLNSTLLTKGNTTLQGTLGVTGATTLSTTLGVTGNTTVGGTLGVTGASSLSSLSTSGNASVGGTLGVTGAVTTSNSVTVGNGLAVTTGATVLGGSLDVSGATTLSSLKLPIGSTTTFDGTVTFTGPVNLPAMTGVSSSSLDISGTANIANLVVPYGKLSTGNPADGNFVFGGGNNVTAGARGVTVEGGMTPDGLFFANAVQDSMSTISGGAGNTARFGYGNTIGGGSYNIVGWDTNVSSFAGYSTVGGGTGNTASFKYSTVAGGRSNTASYDAAAVGGGYQNTASASCAAVAGGSSNVASGTNSMIPGGYQNTASGDLSLAAGRRAKADKKGCFVWGDSTDADISCSTLLPGGGAPAISDRFVVRAVGGVTFYTNAAMTTGITLANGANSWPSASDRNIKRDIHQVDAKAVLEKLDKVPVSTWRYKEEQSQALHMGPMAQDFYAAFGLGDDDKHIVTVDGDGVSLAAIKGVYSVTKEQHKELDELKGEVKTLRDQNKALEARLAKLESSGGGHASSQSSGMFGSLGFLGFAGLGVMLVAGRRRKELP